MRRLVTLSPTGAIGHEPFHEESFLEGLKYDVDFLGADAGSGDIGPYYLGADAQMNPLEWEQHDLELLLKAARERGIPLFIGSAGGAGTNRGVDMYAEILREAAKRYRLPCFRMARIYSEVPLESLRERAANEEIEGLGVGPLTPEAVSKATRVVAMMGVEPYLRALDAGADVVLAGRSCDDAIFAAYPLRAGFPKGLCYHLGKALECASLVCTPSMSKETVRGTITDEYVEIEPMHFAQRATPESVTGHSLYERVHPYRQAYPGGLLDTAECQYQAVTDRVVRVSGSRFVEDPTYRVKLEGAAFVGYRALAIGAIRDPIAIRSVDAVIDSVARQVRTKYSALREGDDFRLLFRVYGVNGVMGKLEPVKRTRAHEICLVVETVAKTQDLATIITQFALYRLLFPTFEGQKGTAGGLALIADEVLVPTHQAYRWVIDHLLPVQDPVGLFKIAIEEVA